jgi:hypothetical protein
MAAQAAEAEQLRRQLASQADGYMKDKLYLQQDIERLRAEMLQLQGEIAHSKERSNKGVPAGWASFLSSTYAHHVKRMGKFPKRVPIGVVSLDYPTPCCTRRATSAYWNFGQAAAAADSADPADPAQPSAAVSPAA